MKVSVLLLTFNEEINIRRCLASLEGIDDILLVDSGSTDSTCDIASEMGARILERPFDDFASQRNFGLENGNFVHDWILHLDADEQLTPEFRRALGALEASDDLDGYRVPSKTILNGKWLRRAGMYPTYQVRLGHRDRLRFKQFGHGQREDSPPTRIATFSEPYLHFNFSHGLHKWFAKHIRYAEDEAEQIRAEKDKPRGDGNRFFGDATERRRALKRLANALPVWLRPPLRFLQIYLFRRGFLDGIAGLQYALMISSYEAMIGAFLLERSNPENSREQREDRE
jgi:glycosyltransferase involved in cell wall biosynthesis